MVTVKETVSADHSDAMLRRVWMPGALMPRCRAVASVYSISDVYLAVTRQRAQLASTASLPQPLAAPDTMLTAVCPFVNGIAAWITEISYGWIFIEFGKYV